MQPWCNWSCTPPTPGDAGAGRCFAHLGVCVGIEETECAAFLSVTVFPEGTKVCPVVECGVIESTLTCCVREHDIDVVVMGNHGHSSFMSLLLGSTIAKLLDWLPCDTLPAREPTAAV
ncbi:universal stress protein [Ottowia sp.]|uniref:universal stress protein n=1 Tax=Ottowia sp. TaxID=1898956 RepID=UPI003A83D72D